MRGNIKGFNPLKSSEQEIMSLDLLFKKETKKVIIKNLSNLPYSEIEKLLWKLVKEMRNKYANLKEVA